MKKISKRPYFLVKYYRICYVLVSFLLINYTSLGYALNWETLSPGLEYTAISPVAGFTSGKLNVFRIDLRNFQMKVIYTKSYFPFIHSVEELVWQHKAVLGINGGFFTEDLKPLGLRINDGKILNELKPVSWWGVFYIKDQHAYIDSFRNFKQRPDIDFAVQAGPRLIVNGQIPNLKPGNANRTALGITDEGKIIIAVTSNLTLTTKDLATILRNQFACQNALNLDGGNSTRLYAMINHFHLNISSITPVSDVILLFGREDAKRSSHF